MPAIELKLTFSSMDEAIAYLQREPRLGSVELPLTVADAKADTEGKPRPSRAPKPETVASPPAAAVTSPPATAAASPASSPAASPSPAAVIEYSTLQKAVFALAGKSRDAAAAVVATFGVKTFKELPPDQWAAALDAVNAKIAEV